jgi:hypothetical protein
MAVTGRRKKEYKAGMKLIKMRNIKGKNEKK